MKNNDIFIKSKTAVSNMKELQGHHKNEHGHKMNSYCSSCIYTNLITVCYSCCNGDKYEEENMHSKICHVCENRHIRCSKCEKFSLFQSPKYTIQKGETKC